MRRQRGDEKNETKAVCQDEEAVLPQVAEDQTSGAAEDSPIGDDMPRHTHIVQVFGVRVRARSANPVECINWNGGDKYAKSVRTYVIERRTMEQACALAAQYGTPIACEKFDLEAEIDRHMTLRPPSRQPPAQFVSPFHNAVAMDELRWNKRVKRIDNEKKHKLEY